MKQYKTKQRNDILSLFESCPDKCFSASDIIKSGSVKAGQATIYRTLNLLAEEKKLLRFRSDGGDFYKLACRSGNHMHIVCEECGSIIHSDCEFIGEISAHLRDAHGFIINPGKTVIYGKCPDCIQKNCK